MRPESRTLDQKIAEVAARQHGVVSRAQLVELEASPSAIRRRVEKGALHPEFRGVYRVGHRAPSTDARYFAAVLAAGDGALLAGRAAAHLMRLLKGDAPPPEVIAPGERRIKGVKTHRRRKLDPREKSIHRGIPVTTVASTLVDLAESLSEEQLARACHEARVLYRTQPDDVEAVLTRRPNVKGAAMLRRILRGDTRLTLSRLERRFLQLLKASNLELPETNKDHGGSFVDCRWPARHLTVELDGYRYHSSRHAWEQDRRRERAARARGDDFRRFTSGDVFDHPGQMLRELRTVLV